MRSVGCFILCVFSAIWAAMGLHSLSPFSGAFPLPFWQAWSWTLPVLVSLGLAGLTWFLTRHDPQPTAEMKHRNQRTAMIWSGIEGVAIFLVINLLYNLHLAGYVVAAIAVIVGLHFYPLALGFRSRLYVLTGSLMIAAACLACVWTPAGALRDATIALASAGILWFSVVLMLILPPRQMYPVPA